MEDHHRAGVVAVLALTLAAGTWGVTFSAQPNDHEDKLERASREALEFETTDRRVMWRDGSGFQAAVTPARAFRNSDGQWCRSVAVEMDPIGAVGTIISRTGCLDAGGQWRLQPPAASRRAEETPMSPPVQTAWIP